MAKQRKKKRGLNPIRLLMVVAMEFLVILGLLIICVKVFPDNPILAPLFSKKAKTPVIVLVMADMMQEVPMRSCMKRMLHLL